jgi:hypothetical protein
VFCNSAAGNWSKNRVAQNICLEELLFIISHQSSCLCILKLLARGLEAGGWRLGAGGWAGLSSVWLHWVNSFLLYVVLIHQQANQNNSHYSSRDLRKGEGDRDRERKRDRKREDLSS